nr:protein trigalactosyldiacylglycerol 4, chloroplastic [Tanacetum cinerariifolium]
MRKLRWVRDDDGLWDLDLSTPATLNGVARPVPGDGVPSVLGLSRGVRLSRSKQVDFFQRFMFLPFIPSYSTIHPNGGFSLQRLFSLPFAPLDPHWYGTVLGQLNVEKLVSNIKKTGFKQDESSPWFKNVARQLSDKSLYAFDLASEFFLTPDDSLLLSLESYGDDNNTPRKKAVFHHKFPKHNLTLEAASPGLFVDKDGSFWDVPLNMAIDLASVASSSDSGLSYHVCVNHNSGPPKRFGSPHDDNAAMVASLQPGLSATTAFSLRNNIDIWRSGAPKVKMVQPYDILLSNPHISAAGIIGGVMTACFGDNSVRAPPVDGLLNGSCGKGFGLGARRGNCAILADSFASVSLSAQLGTFQKMFLDLTRVQALLDFPSGSTFLSGATRVAKDLYNSRAPKLEAVQAVCPNTTLSFQQQLVGPFSFRVDSGVEVCFKKDDSFLKVKDPVFAIEYALQVLGSAKAVACTCETVVCKTRTFALGDKPHSFFAPEGKPSRRGLNLRPFACVCKTRSFALGDKPHSFFAPEGKPSRRGLNLRPLACGNNLPKVTLGGHLS